MASATAKDIGRLFGAGSAVGLTDGELLERFAHRRDDLAEAAFETILARHGAMVLTVCRQVLGDDRSAEDAFQATFLVLLRRAGSMHVRAPGTLGPWLHGVAYRIALKARQGDARRRARERRAAMPAVDRFSATVEQGELQALLHEEVNRLPAKYRAPIVLCYFEGRTHDEAAAALGWPVGTVRGRLARARDRLRTRLTRRGLAPGEWAGAILLGPAVWIEPSVRLVAATVAAAIEVRPSAAVAALANCMLRDVLQARIGMTGAIATVVMVAASSLAYRVVAPQQQSPARASTEVGTTQPRPKVLDLHGEPLPRSARARMGTSRFHDGSPVSQVFYTPNAKNLVTINRDHVVHVWDASSGEIVREIVGPRTEFGDMALSADGQVLATIEQPAGLSLWDLSSGRERRRWHQAKNEDYELPAISPNGRTVAVGVQRFDEPTKKREGFIDLWDTTATTERRRRIPGDWVRLGNLGFSPDGTMLATAGWDSQIMRGNTLIGPDKWSVRLWDVATGQERRRFPGAGLNAGPFAFSPDGRRLAVTVSDGTVRLYDATTGQERMPRIKASAVGCLAFSPDRTILAGGEAYLPGFSLAAIHLWDVASGRELHNIPAHRDGVASLSFAPGGKVLASSGAEPIIRLWDVGTGHAAVPQSGHRSAIRSLAVSPADGTVFTGGDDGTIRRWNASNGQELGVVTSLSGSVEALTVLPDGRSLLSVDTMESQPREVGWIGICGTSAHAEIRRIARIGDRTARLYVACSPDGKTIASEGRIWDIASGKVLVTLRHQDARDDWLLSFCPNFYTRDGKQIITAEADGVRIWDIASGREVRRAIRWSNYHDRATISADGRFLATHGVGGRSRGEPVEPPIVVWELDSGQVVVRLESPDEDILFRPFSPDGRYLASAGGSRGTTRRSAVRIWDLATGREVRRFEGHRGAVNSVAFAPDGRSIVSAGEDATALVWDISELTGLPASTEPITPEALNARWDDLAGNDARAAYRATLALSVPSAVAFLDDRLRPPTSSDPHRIPAATGPVAPPDVLRTLRAITALERVATPASRAVLKRMARGNPGAIETRDAKSALERLGRRLEERARSSR